MKGCMIKKHSAASVNDMMNNVTSLICSYFFIQRIFIFHHQQYFYFTILSLQVSKDIFFRLLQVCIPVPFCLPECLTFGKPRKFAVCHKIGISRRQSVCNRFLKNQITLTCPIYSRNIQDNDIIVDLDHYCRRVRYCGTYFQH